MGRRQNCGHGLGHGCDGLGPALSSFASSCELEAGVACGSAPAGAALTCSFACVLLAISLSLRVCISGKET